MKLDKQEFIKLAEAYLKDDEYLTKLDSATFELAKKYDIEQDFLGLTFSQGSNLFRAVYELLSDSDDWFGYWLCECEKDFDKFNRNVTLKDGTHPNIHSLEDLYDFANIES